MAFRRVLCFSNNSKQLANVFENTFVRCMSSLGGSKNVGFIGLGNMGGHMANHLINKGHKLHVFDISKSASEALRYRGATVYENIQELAHKSDFVVTMLPNTDIVSETYYSMVTDGVNKKTFFIDSSTIDPNAVKTIQKHCMSKGAHFVDAPVSGGVPGAEAATLTFMVGGTKDEYDAVKGILACMGKQITHCGEWGMGQAAKLCNNMMLGISMIGIAEAMNLAIRQGLDAKLFMDIINSSTGRSWASECYNPVPGLIKTSPASNGYKGGFSCDLITKDLGLAAGVATSSNTPIPLGALSHQIYRTLKAKGLGNKDFSVIYDFLKNESNN